MSVIMGTASSDFNMSNFITLNINVNNGFILAHIESRDQLTPHWCTGSVSQVNHCYWDSDRLVSHRTRDT